MARGDFEKLTRAGLIAGAKQLLIKHGEDSGTAYVIDIGPVRNGRVAVVETTVKGSGDFNQPDLHELYAKPASHIVVGVGEAEQKGAVSAKQAVEAWSEDGETGEINHRVEMSFRAKLHPNPYEGWYPGQN